MKTHRNLRTGPARASAEHLEAANDPPAAEFIVSGQRFTLAQMLESNADDEGVADWLRTTKPGDVYEAMHSERVECVAAYIPTAELLRRIDVLLREAEPLAIQCGKDHAARMAAGL